MDRSFYVDNRRALYDLILGDALIVLFSGAAPRRTADAFYGFFANRNFAYLTGLGLPNAQNFVFLARKKGGAVEETLFLLPPDAHLERWNGRRVKADEARALSGVEDIRWVDEFQTCFHKLAMSGLYENLYLDIDRLKPGDPENDADRYQAFAAKEYPFLQVKNLLPHLRALRTIKKPCEIDAMRQAMTVTREGILSMMRASRPGMYEYELKAVYDAALTRNGVLVPAFPPIISAGVNNFCIHYDAYTGLLQDGDMVLNDVGAIWDNECNDVSRGWPVNGKFSKEQRLLYECAFSTSQYMFSILAPGMPMADVDLTARKFNFEQLKKIGLVKEYEEVGRYMWHGGAHHVGFDVHDVVDMTRPVSEGMVFCVDIGIYNEDWGIGFRLEDNCLITSDGCVNLSRDIPRSIDEIENAMAK
jgi:Xaa-Pro aminopeptidase